MAQLQAITPSDTAGATGAAAPMNTAQVLGVIAGIVAVALQPPGTAWTIVITTPLDGL
jgi:hypothetical protein